MSNKSIPNTHQPWLQCTLGDLGTFRKGSGIRKNEVLPYGIPCVRYGEIYTTHQSAIHRCHSFIDQSTASQSERLEYGDVIFAVSGETSEDIGKCSTFLGSYEAYVGSDTLVLRPRGVDPIYLGYALNYGEVLRQKQMLGQGDAVVHLSLTNLLKVKISLPTFPEQEAIGKQLAQVDADLDSIDKLIAKKRDIKQGAMQQLLTGKTRLPGFSEKWKEVMLGGIGTFSGGTGFPLRFQGNDLGDIPFYKVSDMNNQGNEIFMRKANNYVNRSQLQILGAKPFSAGSIVFAKVGAAVFLERKRMLTVESCLDNNMAGYTLQSLEEDPKFIYHWFQQFRLSDLVAATALPSINTKQLSKISCTLPSAIQEQTAIAEVLSDMDAEIDALVARREKTALIKTGMMQELLTGRTRLL